MRTRHCISFVKDGNVVSMIGVSMQFSRVWAMPSKDTYSIKPIYDLLSNNINPFGYNVDPFSGNNPYKDFFMSNDLDPEIESDNTMDALDFLKAIDVDICDLVLFDPPYSPRQVSECYKKLGKTVNMETTQSSYWAKLKVEISRITKKGGKVISFGWNSGGIGKKYGFELNEVLLVPHGGAHNDTICTVESRI